MKYTMLSVMVTGTMCNAKCPFCVSSNSDDLREGNVINTRNLHIVLKLAEKSDVQTAVITGYGEL